MIFELFPFYRLPSKSLSSTSGDRFSGNLNPLVTSTSVVVCFPFNPMHVHKNFWPRALFKSLRPSTANEGFIQIDSPEKKTLNEPLSLLCLNWSFYRSSETLFPLKTSRNKTFRFVCLCAIIKREKKLEAKSFPLKLSTTGISANRSERRKKRKKGQLRVMLGNNLKRGRRGDEKERKEEKNQYPVCWQTAAEIFPFSHQP